MTLKKLPTVPSGDPGALVEAANGAMQRIYRPEIKDPAKVNPIITLFCPDGAISMDDNNPCITYKLCKGCGICARESEGIAMALEYTGPRGIF